MNIEILQFIFSFIAGILWFRIFFFITPIYFKKPLTRSILKLRWHHLHTGIILIFISTILLLLSNKSTTLVIMLGIGFGFIADLFIPSLQMETEREKELVVYRNSLFPTFILGIFIIIIIFILSLQYQ